MEHQLNTFFLYDRNVMGKKAVILQLECGKSREIHTKLRYKKRKGQKITAEGIYRRNENMTDEEYYEFIQPYEDAKQMLLTRLDVLNHNLYGEASARPIHNIQCRIKKKQSIEEKLHRKGKEPTVMNAKDYLQDIAGVRVICYFVDDIYNLTEILKSQGDLIVIKERDYIGSPKPNGYRSYHVVVGVPVYCLDGMEYFPVEIQFRTMSMDFWASMEHRISYKKERTDKEQLRDELREYANMLVEIESRFEQYNETDHQQERISARTKGEPPL